MLFSNLFGKREKPRRFIYNPRYYDPKTDTDRSERMRLDKSAWQKSFSRGRGVRSPMIMLMFVVIVAILIWVLRSPSIVGYQLDDVELTPLDVPSKTVDSLEISQ